MKAALAGFSLMFASMWILLIMLLNELYEGWHQENPDLAAIALTCMIGGKLGVWSYILFVKEDSPSEL